MASTTENPISSLIDELTYNNEVEEQVTKNGGKIIYSYNNMIIVSEISNSFYVELSKNPYIENIYEVPLKRYGNINKNLINQLDITTIPKNQSGGNTGTSSTSGTSGIGTPPTPAGVAPLITNSELTLTALTNILYTYDITTRGTQPIQLSITGAKQNGISISGSVINVNSSNDGIFLIPIKATNAYGTDTKNLIITINEPPVITSILTKSVKLTNSLYYEVKSTGTSPKMYSVTGLTSCPGLSFSDNLITGTPTTANIYSIILGVSNSYGSDSKTLALTVGSGPIITSSGFKAGDENEEFLYNITSSGGFPTGITYNVTGTLPPGLFFHTNRIEGIPTDSGTKVVVLSATNAFGNNEKQLTITITPMHP